jgi:pimeloyl-ACP methyl ester carboxylesterase
VAVRSTSNDVTPARGIGDRAERIPEEPEQIRIDRYSTPGAPDRFEVYIAGTAELAVSGDDEPWDMTSNLTAMAGGSAGSFRAVEEAMHLAGIEAGDPVTFTGYSQGGIIAAQLAASGQYAVDGIVSFGAPAGQVAVPHDIPYLAVEHTNDLVPALGGTFASSEPVVVRRQLFDGPPPLGEYVLPAHRLTHYVETADLVDVSDDPRIEAALRRFEHAPATSVTSTVYLATRSR